MRKTVVIKPTAVVEALGFNHERVAVPCADGVAEPGWIGVRGMAAADGENLPVMIGYLKKNDGECGSLNQFERFKHRDEHRIRDTVRQTHAGRAALTKTVLPLLI